MPGSLRQNEETPAMKRINSSALVYRLEVYVFDLCVQFVGEKSVRG